MNIKLSIICRNLLKSIKNILALLFLFFIFQAFSSNKIQSISPPSSGPVEVSVLLNINKIYDVNTVHETYMIDGYLGYTWVDENLKVHFNDSVPTKLYFENDRNNDIIARKLWFPSFELMNIRGVKETLNYVIEIDSSGRVYFKERFIATFGTEMDFHRFPFDSQLFKVEIEAFSYDASHVVFLQDSMKLVPNNPKLDTLFDKWTVNSVTTKSVFHKSESEKVDYSRAVFTVNAKRKHQYYIWQVLFPLIIIILASFVIFWIKDFSTQIGVGFTLMLTVVAFNFYSASILPKLPYNTFIEYVIIIGYIFIFLGIIVAIINYRYNKAKEHNQKDFLINRFRYIIPLVYLIIMASLVLWVFALKNTSIADINKNDEPNEISNASLYRLSITQAMSPDSSKIYYDLVDINQQNENLVWKNINGEEHLLVVAWKPKDSIYKPYTDSMFFNTGEYPIWVTTAPELLERFKKEKVTDTTMRLKQLLGLPPNLEYNYFIEFWVRPQDLFRPCPDSEIGDRHCELCFPDSADSTHINWINENRISRYYNCKDEDYPWTQLGYTYDWNPSNDSYIGLSEFVIGQNKNIVVNAIYKTNKYFHQDSNRKKFFRKDN